MQAKSSLFMRFNSRPAAERRRAPLLERLLARAVFRRPQADWRPYAYGLLTAEAMPGMAAAALAGAIERGWASPVDDQSTGMHAPGPAAVPAAHVPASRMKAAGAGASSWVYFASPVHHTAGMSSLSLSAGAILRLERDEAEALAIDFARVFGGTGLRLAAAAARLYLVFPSPVRADTHDPEDAVQGDLWECQPSGPDGAYLRGLMSEMEMWLFDHPLNGERLARGAPAITGLWLWGGGPRLAALPEIRGWTAGDDPFFAAFTAADGRRVPDVAGARAAIGDGAAPVGGAPAAIGDVATPVGGAGAAVGAGHGVVVVDACPGSPPWDEAEARWLQPALARLRSGALERLELSAGDSLFGVDARWRRRIWRKTLPWWEQLKLIR